MLFFKEFCSFGWKGKFFPNGQSSEHQSSACNVEIVLIVLFDQAIQISKEKEGKEKEGEKERKVESITSNSKRIVITVERVADTGIVMLIACWQYLSKSFGFFLFRKDKTSFTKDIVWESMSSNLIVFVGNLDRFVCFSWVRALQKISKFYSQFTFPPNAKFAIFVPQSSWWRGHSGSTDSSRTNQKPSNANRKRETQRLCVLWVSASRNSFLFMQTT